MLYHRCKIYWFIHKKRFEGLRNHNEKYDEIIDYTH